MLAFIVLAICWARSTIKVKWLQRDGGLLENQIKFNINKITAFINIKIEYKGQYMEYVETFTSIVQLLVVNHHYHLSNHNRGR